MSKHDIVACLHRSWAGALSTLRCRSAFAARRGDSIETAMLHASRGYIKLEDTLIVTEAGWEAPGDSARGWNVAAPTSSK